MTLLSSDLSYVEKKLISLRVGDPQFPTIINVFPNSWAGDFLKLPLYY